MGSRLECVKMINCLFPTQISSSLFYLLSNILLQMLPMRTQAKKVQDFSLF